MSFNREKKGDNNGQIITEFSFTMIIALIMVFGLIMIFRWAGYDFAWRRVDHDQRLMRPVKEDYGACLATDPQYGYCIQWQIPPREGPIEQLDPYFHKPAKMNAAWGL